MLALLRRIRHSLLKNGRLSHYLLYALGEIVLVVAGILLALQINNWNQERQLREREMVYLDGLINDFQDSAIELDRVIEKTRFVGDLCDSLLNIPLEVDKLDPSLDTLISDAVGYTIFMSNEGTLSDLVGSGNLSLIRNQELRKSLASWTAGLKFIRANEELLQEEVFTYMDQLDSYADFDGFENKGKPLFSPQNRRDIFVNLEYRNKWQGINRHCVGLNELYTMKKNEIDSLVRIVEGELNRAN